MRRMTEWLKDNPRARILELGSGESRLFLPLLEQYPHLSYVGIEPNHYQAAQAKMLLEPYPQALILEQLGYSGFENERRFDIVISLSVLEHVKDLQKFLVFSANCLKSGGRLVHLYDLGHALHPFSLMEKFYVWFCQNNFFSRFIPETKYCGYVAEAGAVKILNDNGVTIKTVTYHNNPQFVSFIKKLDNSPSARARLDQIIKFELEVSKLMRELPPALREKLFPSVCLWGVKK